MSHAHLVLRSCFVSEHEHHRHLHSFPTRRSSDLTARPRDTVAFLRTLMPAKPVHELYTSIGHNRHGKTELYRERSEEHTSELQSPCNLVCRLLLDKKKRRRKRHT